MTNEDHKHVEAHTAESARNYKRMKRYKRQRDALRAENELLHKRLAAVYDALSLE